MSNLKYTAWKRNFFLNRLEQRMLFKKNMFNSVLIKIDKTVFL